MRQNLHLGVTGLRRTGKTVFLTSLIYQLTELGSQGLDRFAAGGVNLRAVKTQLFRSGEADRFPYAKFLANLRTEIPTWPEPTDQEYEYALDFNYENPSANGRLNSVMRYFGRNREQGRIRLHLHDYPGEYLLDVGLLNQTYEKWCDAALNRMCSQLPVIARSYDELASKLGDCMDDEALERLRRSYAEYAMAARHAGLEFVQPAMLLLKWYKNHEDHKKALETPSAEELPFVPLPKSLHAERPSLVMQLKAAYQDYVTKLVERFVKRIRVCRTQLVLVDVLRVLRNGVNVYNDTADCIAEILSAYHQAWRFTGGIRQVHFAATKADHATKDDRANMARLLDSLVLKAKGQIKVGVKTGTAMWFTSLRATDDGQDKANGQHILCGILKGENQSSFYDPGTVPDRWPPDWSQLSSGFPEWKPRTFPKRNGEAVPHLNLDNVLWTILEECF